MDKYDLATKIPELQSTTFELPAVCRLTSSYRVESACSPAPMLETDLGSVGRWTLTFLTRTRH